MKKAYYARPISIDGTPQEKRNLQLIIDMGFEPYPIGEEKKEILKNYKKDGMLVFKEPVENSDCLFFQPFPDGSIGAGVGKEIAWAKDIPIVEIPTKIKRRVLSVDDTREMLIELGQR